MGSRDEDAQAATVGATSGDRPSLSTISDLSPGTPVGRYVLVERLGAGAMGVVWAAIDPQLDRRIAIKLVHPSLARTPEASTRLLREARAMAKLSHRAVVTVHDAGEVEGRLFLAMELVAGTTLGAMLRVRTADAIADWRRWLALMIDAGRGLAAAHDSGVLHRDFKPDNVLVDDAGRVCVGDFGLATLGEQVFADISSRREIHDPLDLTTTGALLGTPAYMAPQQLRGEVIDARADQFSFCVATWEALFGARPFVVTQLGIDAIAALAAAIEDGVLPPPPASTSVPEPVRSILARGLAAAPAARWPDMASLLEALDRASRPAVHVASPPPPRVATAALRLRPRYLVAALAIVVIAGATAFVLGRREPPAEPRPALPVATPGVVAKRLFSVGMRSGIALSPDGRRLALTSDRLEVRALDGPDLWALPLDSNDVVTHVELEPHALRFALRRGGVIKLWRYDGDNSVTDVMTDLGGQWVGHTVAGELAYNGVKLQLWLVDHGREVQRWSVGQPVSSVAVAPDHRRIAYIEDGRYSGRLVVRDVTTGGELDARDLVAPTAVTWLDGSTLLYATGTSSHPQIFRVALEGDRLGPPTEVYSKDAGWFGQLAGWGNRIYVVEMHPSPRARLVERAPSTTTPHDFDNASVALAWTPTGDILTWSQSTKRIERRGGPTVELLKIGFATEPANATTSGDLLLAAIRRPSDRQLVAISLATNERVWSHDDGKTLAARCAGDRHPPCFAVRVGADDQIVSLDPRTGALGTTAIYRGHIEDIAVSDDGTRLLVGSPVASAVLEIDLHGTILHAYASPLTTTRSVAYDPGGGILIAGTMVRNNYQVLALRDGKPTVLFQADDDILSLVRPSADGTRVLVLSRTYAPEVWELTTR